MTWDNCWKYLSGDFRGIVNTKAQLEKANRKSGPNDPDTLPR